MKKYDIAVLDFETMNNHSDSPCEIGISLIKDLKIVNEYHSYINPPNNEYSLQNAKIHKIPKEYIDSAPQFKSIYDDINSLISNSHVYVVSNKQNKLQIECETKNIFLWVYKENSKAINLYKKLGFTIKQETQSRYYMQKIL